MARRSRGRHIDGVLLLDKDTGMSSNFALQRVKRFFNANKAGHTGALDPLATGMLPICLGEATKFSQHLLDADKRYLVTAKLGQRTDTSDSDGEIVSTKDVNVTREQLTKEIAAFVGESDQYPSMYSALKYQGRPLYKYAREGIEVPRKCRKINVFSLSFDEFDEQNNVLQMTAHVSKGTYIRTIVDDLGELLGCGAHVADLRRLAVGSYPIDKMVTLPELESLLEQANSEGITPSELLDPLLLPMESAVEGMPAVFVDEMSANFLRHGNPVQAYKAPMDGSVQVYIGEDENDEKAEFIGVGVVDDDGQVAPKRIVVI